MVQSTSTYKALIQLALRKENEDCLTTTYKIHRRTEGRDSVAQHLPCTQDAPDLILMLQEKGGRW